MFLVRATQNGEGLIRVLLAGLNGGEFSCSAHTFRVRDEVNECRPLSDAVADSEMAPADGRIHFSENLPTHSFDSGPEDTQESTPATLERGTRQAAGTVVPCSRSPRSRLSSTSRGRHPSNT